MILSGSDRWEETPSHKSVSPDKFNVYVVIHVRCKELCEDEPPRSVLVSINDILPSLSSMKSIHSGLKIDNTFVLPVPVEKSCVRLKQRNLCTITCDIGGCFDS